MKFAYSKDISFAQFEYLELAELQRMTNEGESAKALEAIEKCREMISMAQDEPSYKMIKPQVQEIKKWKLGCFVAGAHFENSRRQNEVLSSTGKMMTDWDFKPWTPKEEIQRLRSLVAKDPHTVWIFDSPSCGFKALVDVEEGLDKESWKELSISVQKYFKEAVGAMPDINDITRVCFVSYDPSQEIKMSSKTFELEESAVWHEGKTGSSPDVRLTSGLSLELNSSSSKAIVSDLVRRISALPRLDAEGLISSKHEEMLKIQLLALKYVNAELVNEEDIRDKLFDAWRDLYPNCWGKHRDFDNAWRNAPNYDSNTYCRSLELRGIQAKDRAQVLDLASFCDEFDVPMATITGRPPRESLLAFSAVRLARVEDRLGEHNKLLLLPIQGRDYDVVNRGEVATVVALPGSGKTTHVEAIAAQFVNPLSQKLFLKKSESARRILILDSENKDTGIAKIYGNIANRSGVPISELVDERCIVYVPIVQAEINSGVDIDAKNELLNLVSEAHDSGEPFDLVVIDDVTVLVEHEKDGANNINAASNVKSFLNKLAATYNLAILCTIHSNSQQKDGKARGHIGSDLERYGQSVLYLEVDRKNKSYRLHANSNSAKLRCGGIFELGSIRLEYTFDEELGFMRELSPTEVADRALAAQAGGESDFVFKKLEALIIDAIKTTGTANSKLIKQMLQREGNSKAVVDRKYSIFKEKNSKKFEFKGLGSKGDVITCQSADSQNAA